MRKGLLLVGGVGLGAGLMYACDPEKGKRRRALLRDQTSSILRETWVNIGKKSRDVRNRTRGLVAEVGTHFRCETVSNEVLEERVRSQMGRAVSESGDIEVLAQEGQVILRGVVPAGEADRLLRCVSGVRGVRGVENQLNVRGRHDAGHAEVRANGDGGAQHASKSLPTTARVFTTLAGSSLALYGARRRGVVGSVVGVVGMRMLTRGLGNTALHQSNGRK
jgi:hypothetical protein